MYIIITQALTVVSCTIRFIELKITLHIMYMVIIRPWARNRGVLYIYDIK